MMWFSYHIVGDSNIDILLVLDDAGGTGTRQGLLSSSRDVGLITW